MMFTSPPPTENRESRSTETSHHTAERGAWQICREEETSKTGENLAFYSAKVTLTALILIVGSVWPAFSSVQCRF